eukprot:snap_masked-scaffold_3-processed-gene-3.51-mRNA-1 protein AED:1.00 eAED:1.00 QI:0/0/0/0/1/1/2/0/74
MHLLTLTSPSSRHLGQVTNGEHNDGTIRFEVSTTKVSLERGFGFLYLQEKLVLEMERLSSYPRSHNDWVDLLYY